jgi:hypothetical protein
MLTADELVRGPHAGNEPGIECISAIVTSTRRWLKVSMFRANGDDSRRWPILKLMEAFRHFDATDPRDKLYAPLGFAADIETHELLPDYNLPLTEVYGRLVKFCIDTYLNLDILGYCVTQEAPGTDLPSWIPDWRVEPTREPFSKMSMTKDKVKVYMASGDTKPVVRFPDSFKTLVSRGFHFDTIGTLGRA